MRDRNQLCPLYRPPVPSRSRRSQRPLLYTLCLLALFELPQILASWITVWALAHPPEPQLPLPPVHVQVQEGKPFR